MRSKESRINFPEKKNKNTSKETMFYSETNLEVLSTVLLCSYLAIKYISRIHPANSAEVPPPKV